MKQRILTLAGAAFLAGTIGFSAAAQNLAVVNGKPVPQARLTQLEQQISEQFKRAGRPVPAELKDKLKEEIITREIFMQEADKLGLAGSQDFRDKLELSRQGLLINTLFEDYAKKHPVTDAEAQAEYDKVKKEQEAKFKDAKEYKVSHILVEKEDEAKDVIAKLKKGEKFDEIAKKQSKDPGSGSKGGDLGWSLPDNYVPEFAEAVKKLGKGGLSETPVKSQFGYHIIRVDDVRDAKMPEMPKFEDVKEQIKGQLAQQKIADYQESLRKKAKVE